MKKLSSRTWATVVYQESASEDWLERLENLHIPCYVSPLHDKDGVKEHWHVLMFFQGQKNQDNIKELVRVFGGVGAELVHHKMSYMLYLCHLASEGKHKYNQEDVKAVSGAVPYQDAIQDMGVTRYALVDEMIEWCSENTIYFADLVDYARKYRQDWFKVLVDRNSHLIWEYIKSKTWRNGAYNNVRKVH